MAEAAPPELDGYAGGIPPTWIDARHRATAEGETGHAHGHLEYLAEVFGLLVPLQFVVAPLVAWLGAR